MRFYKKESKRLRQSRLFVKSRFPHFGINKNQEITRLLYEISKRENIPPAEIVKKASLDYAGLKALLLERRYPQAFLENINSKLNPYLPKIELNAQDAADTKEKKFYPKDIFITDNCKNSFLSRQFKQAFPKANTHQIKSLKEYRCKHQAFKIRGYNKRRDTVFIVDEEYDFFKKCPCTKGAVGCGYHIFNLGFGCPFECLYCFLQEYTNSPGIIFPANIERFIAGFKSYKKKGMRIGTGEFCDSLCLDVITHYSSGIIDFFRGQNDVIFEFKTKSAEIQNVLTAEHSGNIVISWSLNPQKIIEENEYFTASLDERLKAAVKCIQAGYKVGFHFDPVIYYEGWSVDYPALLENLFSIIKPKDIAWISIGTFRFSPGLKRVIERRFPQNKILDGELLPGYDGKLRYSYTVRRKIYEKMLIELNKYSEELKVYLCMEDVSMWKSLNYINAR